MSASPDQQQRAADPATPAQDLADLAAAHPDLQAVIARNPSTYPGLLDWLRQYGDAGVQAALDERERAAVAAVTPPPPPPVIAGPPVPPVVSAPAAPGYAPTAPGYAPAPYGAAPRRFIEPSRSIPITYLNHDLRYTLALVGVGLAGLLQTIVVPFALSSVDYSLGGVPYLLVTSLLGLLPWLLYGGAIFVLPSSPRNKLLGLGLVGGPILVLLIQLILSVAGEVSGFPTYFAWTIISIISLLFPFAAIAAWLAARMRPGVAFALLPVALLAVALQFFGVGFFGIYYGYSYGPSPLSVILGILQIGVLVGIAWLARLIAARKATGPTPAERAAMYEAQQHAARVAHLQQWQAAAAQVPGAPLPPGAPVPPGTPPTPHP